MQPCKNHSGRVLQEGNRFDVLVSFTFRTNRPLFLSRCFHFSFRCQFCQCKEKVRGTRTLVPIPEINVGSLALCMKLLPCNGPHSQTSGHCVSDTPALFQMRGVIAVWTASRYPFQRLFGLFVPKEKNRSHWKFDTITFSSLQFLSAPQTDPTECRVPLFQPREGSLSSDVEASATVEATRKTACSFRSVLLFCAWACI